MFVCCVRNKYWWIIAVKNVKNEHTNVKVQNSKEKSKRENCIYTWTMYKK